MKIDKVFIINLEHRIDRREKILKELEKVGIENYEFFKAIKPNVNMVKEWNRNFLNPIPEWFKKTGGDETKYRIGSLGCMLSHYEILKICLQNNYENVLILEDDTEFVTPSGIKFEQILNMVKNQTKNIKFGLFYLAGNHLGSKIESVSQNVNKVTGTLTTGSYIINKSIIKFILDNIKGFEREIDVFYAQIIQKRFPCYCLHPHLTKQGDGYSDIVQRNVSYKLEI
jgi:glycosyl transferase family 25